MLEYPQVASFYLIGRCCEKPQQRQAGDKSTNLHTFWPRLDTHTHMKKRLVAQTDTANQIVYAKCRRCAHTHTHTWRATTVLPLSLSLSSEARVQPVSVWNELEKNKNKKRRSGWEESTKIIQNGKSLPDKKKKKKGWPRRNANTSENDQCGQFGANSSISQPWQLIRRFSSLSGALCGMSA